MASSTLPLFHLYGDPPDDSAFDFIHIETIASRSSVHDWTIRAHRHRNLFQILLIEKGGAENATVAVSKLISPPPFSINRIWNRLRWRCARIVQSCTEEREAMVSIWMKSKAESSGGSP